MDVRKHIPQGYDAEGYKRRRERIKDYIHQNPAADLSAAAVAEKFDLSVSSLLHLFTEWEHKTFRRYVEEVRMQAAFDIIRRGGRVKEAMYATGYKNRATFHNAFKKRFKHPPTYFR